MPWTQKELDNPYKEYSLGNYARQTAPYYEANPTRSAPNGTINKFGIEIYDGLRSPRQTHQLGTTNRSSPEPKASLSLRFANSAKSAKSAALEEIEKALWRNFPQTMMERDGDRRTKEYEERKKREAKEAKEAREAKEEREAIEAREREAIEAREREKEAREREKEARKREKKAILEREREAKEREREAKEREREAILERNLAALAIERELSKQRSELKLKEASEYTASPRVSLRMRQFPSGGYKIRIVKPVKKPVKKPKKPKKPVKKPVNKPVNKPTKKPVKKPSLVRTRK